MSGFIYISSLFDMPRYVRELGPSHLVSIIQPELQPERPPEVVSERHLRVAVHDVSEPDGFSVLARSEDVRRLIDFSTSWRPPEGPLLVHCYAGVSRSTAAALIAHVLRSRDPRASVTALREAAPYAMPNRRLVALADEELGFGGALVEATERMGPPGFRRWDESLAVLPLSQ